MSAPLPFDPIAETGRHWHEHWGAQTVAPVAAVTSLMRAHQIVMARLNEVLEPDGLSYAQYEALMLLFYSRNGSLPLGKMGARLQLHPTSVTNLVDKLERLGYVDRATHPTDRRTVLAEITATGREVAARATGALNAGAFGTAPLEAEDLLELQRILRVVRLGAGDFTEE